VCAHVNSCTATCGAVGGTYLYVHACPLAGFDTMQKLRKDLKNSFPFCFLGSFLLIAARILGLRF